MLAIRLSRPLFRPHLPHPVQARPYLLTLRGLGHRPRYTVPKPSQPTKTKPNSNIPIGVAQWRSKYVEHVYIRIRNFIKARRWLQYVLYFWALATGYLYVTCSYAWARYREDVPITGRRRYAGSSRNNAQISDVLQKIQQQQQDQTPMASETEVQHLPAEHPLVIRVQRVLSHVLQAAGLDQRPWRICIVDQPGE